MSEVNDDRLHDALVVFHALEPLTARGPANDADKYRRLVFALAEYIVARVRREASDE